MAPPGHVLTRTIAQRIRREGPIPFDVFMELALYDPEHGFFATGGGAGRHGGDFVTSPEVGSLFGACVARAHDRWWHALGEPDPFLVVEAGAGSGRLAGDVLRAGPECAPALRYVLVERSAPLRALQAERLPLEPADEALGPFVHATTEDEPVPVPAAGPVVAALEDLPAVPFEGVVFANELLDNLPFGIAQFDGAGWREVRVGVGADGALCEVLVPLPDPPPVGDHVPVAGVRVPIPRGLDAWVDACGAVLRRGFLVVVDYVMEAPRDGWLRTYRGHGPGGHPLEAPGTQDVTGDVLYVQLERAAHRAGLETVARTSQAEWLRTLGIDELVAQGRAAWHEGAARGDLAALAGRSRVREADALTDPGGLGAHTVVVFRAGGRR
ncbi:MAG: ATP synthase subunit beta [Acidimicrobiia bacterium]|nr:MAG: ATP synthase subunit beta [Acidimicrobiia bacterium]